MLLEQTATEWVNLLIAGKFDQTVQSFADVMSAQMTADKLKDIWNSIITQFGVFKGIKGTRATPYGGYNIVFVTCDFNQGVLDIQLTYDADMKIAGLFFKPPT